MLFQNQSYQALQHHSSVPWRLSEISNVQIHLEHDVIIIYRLKVYQTSPQYPRTSQWHPGKCHRMHLIKRIIIIYGLLVGLWQVYEMFSLLWSKCVGHDWVRSRGLPSQCYWMRHYDKHEKIWFRSENLNSFKDIKTYAT